jgi:hypothetical protein
VGLKIQRLLNVLQFARAGEIRYCIDCIMIFATRKWTPLKDEERFSIVATKFILKTLIGKINVISSNACSSLIAIVLRNPNRYSEMTTFCCNLAAFISYYCTGICGVKICSVASTLVRNNNRYMLQPRKPAIVRLFTWRVGGPNVIEICNTHYSSHQLLTSFGAL